MALIIIMGIGQPTCYYYMWVFSLLFYSAKFLCASSCSLAYCYCSLCLHLLYSVSKSILNIAATRKRIILCKFSAIIILCYHAPRHQHFSAFIQQALLKFQPHKNGVNLYHTFSQELGAECVQSQSKCLYSCLLDSYIALYGRLKQL